MASKRQIGMFVIVAVLVGCEEKKLPTPPQADVSTADAAVDAGAPKPVSPLIIKDEGPMPGPDTPIATAGDFKVTVADFEESSRISLLFAPDGQTDLPPERLAIPHVHVTMARSLLSQKVINAELEKRGIAPTTEELHAYLRDHPRLRRFGALIDDPDALAAALKPLGLEPKHLLRVAWDELGNKMLASAMVAEISDDEIWKAYAFQNTTKTAALAELRNIPTSEEIDEFVGKHAAEIDEHFKQNQRKYRTPRRIKLNVVRPQAGTKTDKETLEKAAKLLDRGVQPATVAKETGLEHELGLLLVRGENPQAFRMKPGEVGWVPDGARGAMAWKVVGFENSRLPEMSRPLRREIAAELLRTQSVVPSVAAKLAEAEKILAAQKLPKPDQLAAADPMPKAAKKIEALGLTFSVATFPNEPRTPLPKHGLSEEVIAKAFTLDVGKTVGPILSRERGFSLRVVGANTPSRKDFDANIDANRRAFVTAMEPRIVTQWVERELSRLNAKIDVKPLRIKYGVLQKGQNVPGK